MFVEGGGHFFRNQRLSIEWLHDHANGQAVLAAELEVALVMRRDGHNRPSPVFHQDEIPYPDRKLFTVERIGGVAAGEEAFLLGRGQVLGFYPTLTHASQLAFPVRLP